MRCGEDSWPATEGSFVLLPRGVPHAFAATGGRDCRFLQITSPAKFEAFVAVAGRPAQSRTLPPSRRCRTWPRLPRSLRSTATSSWVRPSWPAGDLGAAGDPRAAPREGARQRPHTQPGGVRAAARRAPRGRVPGRRGHGPRRGLRAVGAFTLALRERAEVAAATAGLDPFAVLAADRAAIDAWADRFDAPRPPAHPGPTRCAGVEGRRCRSRRHRDRLLRRDSRRSGPGTRSAGNETRSARRTAGQGYGNTCPTTLPGRLQP